MWWLDDDVGAVRGDVAHVQREDAAGLWIELSPFTDPRDDGIRGDELSDSQRSVPFYYRIHSPVVLVEFDQHAGVIFDNAEPSSHHIHTIIRTPNGGDYGLDLLAQHHAGVDHSTGSHTSA